METVFYMCDHWFDMGIERYRMLMWTLREGLCILFDLISELSQYFERARIVNLKMDSTVGIMRLSSQMRLRLYLRGTGRRRKHWRK